MIFFKCNNNLTRLKKELNEDIVNGTAVIQNLSPIIISRINLILNENNFEEGILFLIENWINELNIVLNEEEFLKENVLTETIKNLYFISNLMKYVTVENVSVKNILETAQKLEILKLEINETLPVNIKIYDYLSLLNTETDDKKIKTLLSLFCRSPSNFNFEKNSEYKDLFIFDVIRKIYSNDKGFNLIKELLDNLLMIIEKSIEENKDEDHYKVEKFFNDEVKNINYINSDIFVPNHLFLVKYGNGNFINYILKKENDIDLKILETIIHHCPDKIILFQFNHSIDKEKFSYFVKIINKNEKILSVLKISFENFIDIFSWDFILNNGHGLYFEDIKVQEDYLLNIPYDNKNDIEKVVKNLFSIETNIYNVELKKSGERIKNKILNFCYKKIPYMKKIMTNLMIEKVNEMVNLRNKNVFKFNYDEKDLENKLNIIEEFYKNKDKISSSFMKKEKNSSKYILSLHPDNLLIFFLTNLDIGLSSKIEIVHNLATKFYINEDVFWIFYLMKMMKEDIKLIEKEIVLNTSKDYNMLKNSLTIVYSVRDFDSSTIYRNSSLKKEEENYELIKNLLNSRGEKSYIKEIIAQNTLDEEVKQDEDIKEIEKTPRKRRL